MRTISQERPAEWGICQIPMKACRFEVIVAAASFGFTSINRRGFRSNLTGFESPTAGAKHLFVRHPHSYRRLTDGEEERVREGHRGDDCELTSLITSYDTLT